MPLTRQVLLLTSALGALALAVILGLAALAGALEPPPPRYSFPAELDHPAATGVYVASTGARIAVDPAAALPAAVLDDLAAAVGTPPAGSDHAVGAWHDALTERVAAVETAGRRVVVVVEGACDEFAVTYPAAVADALDEFPRRALWWDSAEGAREDAEALQEALPGESWELVDLLR
ncbi:hypothetical protein [Actinotalea sp. JY-7885]|uniref:hypothetical protein n=1 Tax=Actinotalea sp. JY-7885 TaxID=2758576 RepID=UPI00165DB608|nr:hypothetical protein [Actinotalea sp. JY-7885]